MLQDMVWLGLSPEWQHSVNEWRTTKQPVDADWIWHRLISTMGWQRPNQTIYIKTLTGTAVSLRVHPTWTVAAIESLLEIVHGVGPEHDYVRMVFAGRRLDCSDTLRDVGVSDESTLHLIPVLRGD